jgi:hypothetical protein
MREACSVVAVGGHPINVCVAKSEREEARGVNHVVGGHAVAAVLDDELGPELDVGPIGRGGYRRVNPGGIARGHDLVAMSGELRSVYRLGAGPEEPGAVDGTPAGDDEAARG